MEITHHKEYQIIKRKNNINILQFITPGEMKNWLLLGPIRIVMRNVWSKQIKKQFKHQTQRNFPSNTN